MLLGVSAPAEAGWQPAGTGDDRFHCGTAATTETQYGYVRFQACVIVDYRANGAYYQGLVSAYYRSTRVPAISDSFTGGIWSYIDGIRAAGGSCGTATFSHGAHKWCFTATNFASGHGHKLYAKGHMAYRGAGTYVYSPVKLS
jgi:hypothetical protein